MTKLTTRGTARLKDIAEEYKRFINSQIGYLVDPTRRRGLEGINDVKTANSITVSRGKLSEYKRLVKKFSELITAIEAKQPQSNESNLDQSFSSESKDTFSNPMSISGDATLADSKESTTAKSKIETDEAENTDSQIAFEFLPKLEELMREAARLFYFNRYGSPWDAQSWTLYKTWGAIKGSIPGFFSQTNVIDKISLILRQIFLSTITDKYGRATSVAVIGPKIQAAASTYARTPDSKDPLTPVPLPHVPEEIIEATPFKAVDDFNVLKGMPIIDSESKEPIESKESIAINKYINHTKLFRSTKTMIRISDFFIDNITKQKELLREKKERSWWMGAWNINTHKNQPQLRGKLELYEQLEKLFRNFNTTVFHHVNNTAEQADQRLVELQELIRLTALVYSMRRLGTEATSWKGYKTWGSDIGPFSQNHNDPIAVKLRQTYLQTLTDREGRAIRIFDTTAKKNVTVDDATLLRRLLTDEYVDAKKKSISLK